VHRRCHGNRHKSSPQVEGEKGSLNSGLLFLRWTPAVLLTVLAVVLGIAISFAVGLVLWSFI